ncbi:MAG: tolB protein precursor, periplasmic protein involved in the tonb-independent uptake of group A colicins, partial [uncultured Gemmatimonadaceae bacterium]
ARRARAAGARRRARRTLVPAVDRPALDRRAGDRARRRERRLHRDGRRLGEQPVRQRDLDRASRRGAVPAHLHREGEQHGAPLVAGRPVDRLPGRPRRRAADLPDPRGGRRGAAPDEPQGRRHRLRVVARRLAARLHRHRARERRGRGAQAGVRRLHGGGRRLPPHAPLAGGRRHRRAAPGDRVPDGRLAQARRRLHRAQLRGDARRAARPHRGRAQRRRLRVVARRAPGGVHAHPHAAPELREPGGHRGRGRRVGGGARGGRGARRRHRPGVVARRHAAALHDRRRRHHGQLLPQRAPGDGARGGRPGARAHRPLRRGPRERRVAPRRHPLPRGAGDEAAPLRARPRHRRHARAPLEPRGDPRRELLEGRRDGGVHGGERDVAPRAVPHDAPRRPPRAAGAPHRDDQAGGRLVARHARGGVVGEPRRRAHRGGAVQAERLRSPAPLPAARGDPRRPHRRVAPDARRRGRLPGGAVPREGGGGADAQLPRVGGLRGEVPRAQRAQPGRGRRVGRALGRGLARRARHRRLHAPGQHGVEPGRLHLGVPHHHHAAVQGRVRGRRDLQLDDLLREHGHPPVHAPVPAGHALGRPGDLREDLADHVREAGADAHAHPARRVRPPRPDRERVRAVP